MHKPEREAEEQIEEKRARLEDVARMTEEVGFCWMRRGNQKPLRTPGTNRKV